MVVARGKAARPQPWDESRVIEGAPQGILNRGTPHIGAQHGNGGSEHINQSECECESEELRPAANAYASATASAPEKTARTVPAQTIQLFNSSTLQLFLPAPAGLNVCSPGQGRQAAALGCESCDGARGTGNVFSRDTSSLRLTR